MYKKTKFIPKFAQNLKKIKNGFEQNIYND